MLLLRLLEVARGDRLQSKLDVIFVVNGLKILVWLRERAIQTLEDQLVLQLRDRALDQVDLILLKLLLVLELLLVRLFMRLDLAAEGPADLQVSESLFL